MKAEDYFKTAYSLVARFADSNIGKYISANVGKTVDSDDLLAEFVKDFGEDNRDLITFRCENIQGVAMLSEVRTYLSNPLPTDMVLHGMLTHPGVSEEGNCPKEIFIDSVHGNN